MAQTCVPFSALLYHSHSGSRLVGITFCGPSRWRLSHIRLGLVSSQIDELYQEKGEEDFDLGKESLIFDQGFSREVSFLFTKLAGKRV